MEQFLGIPDVSCSIFVDSGCSGGWRSKGRACANFKIPRQCYKITGEREEEKMSSALSRETSDLHVLNIVLSIIFVLTFFYFTSLRNRNHKVRSYRWTNSWRCPMFRVRSLLIPALVLQDNTQCTPPTCAQGEVGSMDQFLGMSDVSCSIFIDSGTCPVGCRQLHCGPLGQI